MHRLSQAGRVKQHSSHLQQILPWYPSVVSAGTGAICLLIARACFPYLAFDPDSAAYLFQAKLLAQGVLAADDPNVWPRIEGVDAAMIITWLNSEAKDFGRDSTADLCLAYARGQSFIDGVVVGMETEAQLEVNLALAARPPLSVADCAALERRRPRVPAKLLDPAQWAS